MSILDNKSLVIITGASRGYGKAVAAAFAQRIQLPSTFVLLASNADTLESTANTFRASYPNHCFHSIQCDLSCRKSCERSFEYLVDRFGSDQDKYDSAILIHNAATIGQISSTSDNLNIDKTVSYLQLNYISVIMLNAKFVSMVDEAKLRNPLIINITSNAAKEAFIYTTEYCSIKAAREMLFKVFSLEHATFRVLSFHPGLLDTDMMDELKAKSLRKEQIKAENWSLLTCAQSADRLLEVLEHDKFENAAHVAYYDEME